MCPVHSHGFMRLPGYTLFTSYCDTLLSQQVLEQVPVRSLRALHPASKLACISTRLEWNIHQFHIIIGEYTTVVERWLIALITWELLFCYDRYLSDLSFYIMFSICFLSKLITCPWMSQWYSYSSHPHENQLSKPIYFWSKFSKWLNLVQEPCCCSKLVEKG